VDQQHYPRIAGQSKLPTLNGSIEAVRAGNEVRRK
jgi:hypothetical protein